MYSISSPKTKLVEEIHSLNRRQKILQRSAASAFRTPSVGFHLTCTLVTPCSDEESSAGMVALMLAWHMYR